ncbi:ABC transporter ATP-binding protein [Cognatishimia sp. SS12]|uniref:ABC transporter ATP-binding protein n=1 Tax=Cognatishimia sp. SS12 TaxID=2979465 RepID=UPI00232E9C47|nr:ABC transporter ATP-binding protein [Cognatishimia sp. SS12]MDC0739361.1 ABC transporter ATP-binding protein [Cognatishimia sp. SS12]
MIRLVNLHKSFATGGGSRKHVAQGINAVFPAGQSVALLGRNGAGKSTLLGMIAGTIAPDAGRIVTRGSVSWTVGFAGTFHGDLTGAQNARFVARIYGVDSDEMLKFAADFADLGAHFHMPLRSYSAGMKARLAFGVSMAVPFDTYLVDEVTAVGDARFRDKSAALLKARLTHAGAVVVSHSMAQLRDLCSAGAVLDRCKLHYYEDIEAAIAHHMAVMQR